MTRLVLSMRAEIAITELMYTLAAHERWRRTRLLEYGRLPYMRAVPTPDSIEHLTVPHIAAVAEEFAHSTLLEASEPLVPQANAILIDLWKSAERQIEKWTGLTDSWSAWHGVGIRS